MIQLVDPSLKITNPTKMKHQARLKVNKQTNKLTNHDNKSVSKPLQSQLINQSQPSDFHFHPIQMYHTVRK